MTRVLHVIKSLGRGGAETLLVEGLKVERSLHLEYAYLHAPKSDLVEDLRAAGALVHLVAGNSIDLVGRAVHLARLIRTRGIDLVHAHLPIAGVIARMAGRMARVPVVYTEHYVLEKYHPASRSLDVLTWEMQSAVVACSADVARSIRAHVPHSHVPIETISNGVSAARFAAEADLRARTRAQLGVARDEPVVVTVAVFRAQKRLDLWLDAAETLLQTHPRASFVIVGDGPEWKAINARMAQRGLQDRVTLTGLQADPRPWLAAADVFMLSSDGEGLPVALLEAMSMRLPIVATAVGGIPEVVGPSMGVLFPPGNPAALAAGAARVLGLPAEERATMGENARAHVVERFSIDAMQERLRLLYERVIAGGVGPARAHNEFFRGMQ